MRKNHFNYATNKNDISFEAHIDRSKYDFCSMTDTELEEYHKETKKLKDSSIFVDDTPECTVEEICDKCRSYKADHGVEVVFIDYLQLVSSDFKTESRSKEMLYICGKLKELAKELDLPIVVLSQLSRAVEQRKSHRPKISDFSDLVGDAVAMFDVILFLYRHEYYHRNSYRKGIAELIVARSGKTKKRSSCLLMWLQPFLKFANLESW